MARSARQNMRIMAFLAFMTTAGAVFGQKDLVPIGGSSLFSIDGVVEYTIGQVFCEQGVQPDEASIAEGVQQPYTEQPPTECDTLFFENEITTCDSIIWYNRKLNIPGVYRHTAVGNNECDSVFILTLNLRYSTHSYDSAEASRTYIWQGTNYLQSGNYTHRLRDANTVGCDSILHLHLALLNGQPIPHIRCYDRRLLVVDHYPNGEDGERADYVAYRWYLNGHLIAMATNDYYTEFVDGEHKKLTGCFYVEVSAGDGFWVKSNEICIEPDKGTGEPTTMEIFPNPTTSNSTITIILDNTKENDKLEIYDIQGRRTTSIPAKAGENHMTVPDASGTYSVVLRTEDKTIVKKLIVR